MLLSEYDKSAVELASSALNQILKFHYQRETITPKQMPPRGLLYHYTTADGLKGIIEKNELWATSAYFLNDSAEITYGYGLLILSRVHRDMYNPIKAANRRDRFSVILQRL